MIRSLFSGISGMENHQTRMDVIGNNISNVNTTGYKAMRANFQDALYQTIRSGGESTNPTQVGLGSTLSGISNDMSQGTLKNSGRTLDLALNGNGFLKVLNNADQAFYTRGGTFHIDPNGSMVDADGNNLYGQTWATAKTTSSTGKITEVDTSKEPVSSPLYSDIASTTLDTSQITGLTVTNDNSSYTIDLFVNKDGGVKWSKDGGATWSDVTDASGNDVTFDLNGDTITLAGWGSTGGQNITADTGAQIQFKIEDTDSTGSVTESVTNLKYNTMGTLHATTAVSNITGLEEGDSYDVQVMKQSNDLVYTKVGSGSWQKLDGGAGTVKITADKSFDLDAATLKNGDAFQFNISPRDSLILKGSKLGSGTTEEKSIKINPASLTVDAGTYKTDGSEDIKSVFNLENSDQLVLTYENAQGEQDSYTLDIQSGGTISESSKVSELRNEINSKTNGQITMNFNGTPNGNGDEKVLFRPSEYKEGYTLIAEVLDSSGNYKTGAFKGEINDNGHASSTFSGDNLESIIRKVNEYSDYTGVTASEVEGNLRLSSLDKTENGTMSISGSAASLFGVSGDFSASTAVNRRLKLNLPPNTSVDDLNIQPNGMIRGEDSEGGSLVWSENGHDGARIPLYNFENEEGLQRKAKNLYQESTSSGEPTDPNVAGSTGFGTVQSGYLEMSNVELTDEFTNMITTQRGYQASSRIITVSDAMMKELINLKR
ncbi:MAG: flagellar hook-basal body complex protein [Clostridiales bacterium]|nr:flagellar hook-basal body complex protein [Clostridiales bacterium]MCF8021714.1 flagellar hook-basal body complex protein [Clostridiales bacterium]